MKLNEIQSDEDEFYRELTGTTHRDMIYVEEYFTKMYDDFKEDLKNYITTSSSAQYDFTKILDEFIFKRICEFAEKNGFEKLEQNTERILFIKRNKNKTREYILYSNNSRVLFLTDPMLDNTDDKYNKMYYMIEFGSGSFNIREKPELFI